jgi:dATP pyrophosphohydrolase
VSELPPGYQPHTSHGAKIRADVIDVYVFRLAAGIEFLQLLRSGAPLENTWHPVMGHVHAGETSVACARREMQEELGLAPRDRAIVGMWALEQVHPFYIASIDTVVMSPRFACEVRPEWTPRLNDEHTAHRWVRESDIDAMFMWPGQKACCREILREIVANESLSREGLRVK